MDGMLVMRRGKATAMMMGMTMVTEQGTKKVVGIHCCGISEVNVRLIVDEAAIQARHLPLIQRELDLLK